MGPDTLLAAYFGEKFGDVCLFVCACELFAPNLHIGV